MAGKLRAVLACGLAASAALCSLAAPAARATPVTYDFTGTIYQVSDQIGAPPGRVGDQVPISITVDLDAPGRAGPNGSTIYGYGPPGGSANSTTPVIQAASIGNFSALQGSTQTVTVEPGQRIAFATSGRSSAYGFMLSLFYPHAGVLTTGGLPASLDAGDFTAGTFSVTEFGSPSVEGYDGAVNGVRSIPAAVPEPGTMGLLAFGLLALAVRWRKAWPVRLRHPAEC